VLECAESVTCPGIADSSALEHFSVLAVVEHRVDVPAILDRQKGLGLCLLAILAKIKVDNLVHLSVNHDQWNRT